MAIAAILASTTAAAADERLLGPIPAEVLRVIDGDTLLVRARIWLGQQVEIRLRLVGIDTPERRGRCPREFRLAAAARDFTVARAANARVRLRDIHYGKFAGRVLGRVELPDGEDLGAALIAAGLARAYDGGARGTWCGVAALVR